MRRKILHETSTHRIVKKNGGWRAGSGRPKGTKNKKTIVLEKYISEAMDEAKGKGGGIPTALEIYQAIYRNPNIPQDVRRDAMAKALPYEDARRKASEFVDPNGGALASRFETARASLKGKLVTAPGPELGSAVDRLADGDRSSSASV